MKPVDEQLNRLLKSAAAAPSQAPGEPPFALEAHVMGAWRGAVREGDQEFLVVWFRRAAICGCVMALASLAWDFHGHKEQMGAEMTVASSAMGMGVEP